MSNSFEDGVMMNNDRYLLVDLDLLHGIATATISHILGVREHVVWKWATGQAKIPPGHRKKLEELFRRLGKAEMSKLTACDHK